jgi:hypothetical protein
MIVVDEVMEVIDEYQSRILKLEHDILLKPQMKSVRYCMYALPSILI